MKRIELFKKYIKDKRVLDIGCIDHDANYEAKENWLHKQMIPYAKYIMGLDYIKNDVKALQKKNYNIVYKNAENFNLNTKFDVIVAAELIEHLFNPGRFLDSVKQHMHKKSRLILTTPNVFTLGNVYRILKRIIRTERIDNSEHVVWYDIQTLSNLLKRKGFQVCESTTFYPDRYPAIWDISIPKMLRSKIFIIAKLKNEKD